MTHSIQPSSGTLSSCILRHDQPTETEGWEWTGYVHCN